MSEKILSQPYKLGDLELKNRFVMAPLTRCRGDPKTGIPNDLMVEYYTQRATFGLIITECSQISNISEAFPGSGGIYTKEQAEGWRKVVDSVHQKGGKIYMQIWHCGRAVVPDFIGGENPISSSNLPIRQTHIFTKKPHPVPTEMTQEDIKKVVEQFRQGAIFAKEAGFDGIQLHGANGYLVDQFLRDGVNKRTDNYGGSIENRSRFLLEVIDALISVFGANRTSVRLSPTGRFGDMFESNPIELMKYVLKELSARKLQFVEIKRHGQLDSGKASENDETVDSEGRQLPKYQVPDFYKTMRQFYKGILMGNDGFTTEEAEEKIKNGEVDIVSFGRLSINNPDLPSRYQNNQEYNTDYDFSTFYVPGEKGYTDFLPYEEWKKSKEEQQKQEA